MRTGLRQAALVSFRSAAAAGLTVSGCSVLGLTGLFLFLTEQMDMTIPAALPVLLSFVAGTASAALLLGIAGGIFQAASAPSALLGASGELAGTVAGGSSDLLGSSAAALAAAMVLAVSSDEGARGTEVAMLFVLLLAALGIVAGIFGTFAVRPRQGSDDVGSALKSGIFVASALFLGGAFFLGRALLPSQQATGAFTALTAGTLLALLLGILLEYASSADLSPVRRLGGTAKEGTAALISHGLAIGFLWILPLSLLLTASIAIAYRSAGFYGVTVSAVSMLSLLALPLAFHAFGPITWGGARIARLAQLPKHVCVRAETLASGGRSAVAFGKVYTLGSSVLTALALLAALAGTGLLSSVDLMKPLSFFGFLAGGMLPFAVVGEILRVVRSLTVSLNEELSVLERAQGDPLRCVRAGTTRATCEASLLMLLAIAAPLFTGLVLGTEALGGLLFGSLLSSLFLGFLCILCGSAWGGVRSFVEAGNLGGEGSAAHQAAAGADTLGSSLRDAALPAIGVLLKTLMIVSLLTAGFCVPGGVFG